MKRILTILALATFPCLATAQEQGWGAKFFREGLTHDFGNVPYGSKLSYKFPIKNDYNQTFRVTEATVSCGCVTPKKPALDIAPLGTSELEISMDTLRINPPGPKKVDIFVTFVSVPVNPGDKVYSSRATLSVSCVPKTNVVFKPGEVNFGQVNQGQTPKQLLTIEHAGDPNWQIKRAVVREELPVQVTVQQQPAGQPGMVFYQVQATLKSNAPAGEFKQEIQLETSDPQTPVLNLVVSGNVQAPLKATPNIANFGTAKVHEVTLRSILLQGNKPFKITKVEGAGGEINVKFGDRSASVQVLNIEYTPMQAGALKKVLTIKTDLDGELSTTVTAEGTASP
ncbi:MAG TPA: DUF1573 domain-containing protein [Gemmataceae bacterium]|nr:DUF1573 domain-containing protein [Gemmataceae bacterium]